MRFSTIEVNDLNFAKEVIQQAITNMGDHAKITSIAIDRGFMDGTLLWWLNFEGIIFYIPAKSNMNVYEDALSLVDNGYHSTRTQNCNVGYGKNKTVVTDYWEVVGIEGLTTAGFYGPLGSGSHENRKDFVPNPINAVLSFLIRIVTPYLMPTKSLFFAVAMFSCPPVYPKKLPKRIYYESIAYKWNDL